MGIADFSMMIPDFFWLANRQAEGGVMIFHDFLIFFMIFSAVSGFFAIFHDFS